jgi:hypothetical protein
VNVFFDVDYTILGEDGSLRPHTVDVFTALHGLGHATYIWSGVGDRTSDVKRIRLDALVQGVHLKPLSDFEAGLRRLGIPVIPDFVVDDHPDVVEYFGGFCIKPYGGRLRPDDELLVIPRLVSELASRDANASRGQLRPALGDK